MSQKKTTRGIEPKLRTRTAHEVLAAEASDWAKRPGVPADFVEDEAAVPRAQEATAISIRIPRALLALLKKFAEREGVGYQVLIKRWLDDRLRMERERLREERSDDDSRDRCRAPQFPLRDRGGELGHYEH
ncbi:MAG TPA: CopG family antitoxin [Kofleriaceae bacterium]|nr:CopG family antitoxin [Kofleriaceae bacterium]